MRIDAVIAICSVLGLVQTMACSRSSNIVTSDPANKVKTVTLSTQTGKLPNNYPKDVPIPVAAKVAMSSSFSNEESFFAAFESSDTADRLVAFYENALAANAWTIDSTRSSAGVTRFAASKGKRRLSVSIGDQDGKRIISQTVVTGN